ncbi:MAG: S9 family peptidase [Sphingomonas sp.]
MKFFGLGLLLAGATAGVPAIAQQQDAAAKSTPAPLDAAVFAEIPAVEAPELSPDGKQLAAKIAVNGVQYFAVVPLDGSKPHLVGLKEMDLNWWQWVNDDWLVLGVGQLSPVEGDKWYISRAVSVSAKDGHVVNLATRDAAQDADDLLWTATDGTPRVLIAGQTSIYSTDAGFWPQVDEVDVSNGKHKRVLPGREGVFNWFADAKGVVRMGVGGTLDGRTRRVVYRESERASFHVIDRAKSFRDGLTIPTLFLDQPNKALVVADDEQGFSALYELDLATMARGKQLFASKGYDIGGLVGDGTGAGYLGVRVNEDKPAIRWTDPAIEAMHKAVAAGIKGGEPRIVSLSRDRKTAIVQVGGPSAPGAYFLYRSDDGSMLRLSTSNTTIGLKLMHPVKTIRYKARDGLEIAAVLTLPRGKTGKLPLIVMPHGGPYARDSEEWDWWAQFLADRGYAVVQPNYRGSSGYGTSFAAKGEGQWGLAMQDDLNDAVTALADLGIADPGRVCMVGASYGGYAALRAAQRDGKLYRCAVSYAGVSDLNRMISYDSAFLGSESRKDWLRAQAPDFKQISPLFHPEQFSIPVLLVHGKKDRVVPINQSRVMVDKLKEAGKNVTYIEQPEADHHFTRSQDRLEFLKALEVFLAKYNPS